MNPIQLMKINETNMTPSEMKIMEYLISNLDDIQSYPMVDVASRAETSRSALLRFCQKLGYDGYSQFKYAVTQYLSSPSSTVNTAKESKSIAAIYSETILKLDETIDLNSLQELKTLFKEANKIKVFGYAETGLTATHFCQRLLDINYDAQPISSVSTITANIDVASEEDLLIFFTLSGNTSIIKNAIAHARSLNRKIVLVTQNDMTPMRQDADCFILLPFHDYENHDFILDSQIILHGFIGIFINYIK